MSGEKTIVKNRDYVVVRDLPEKVIYFRLRTMGNGENDKVELHVIEEKPQKHGLYIHDITSTSDRGRPISHKYKQIITQNQAQSKKKGINL